MSDYFIENITYLMEKYNLNQSDLSYISGVSRQTISKWLLGTAKPKYDKLEKIGDYFGLTAPDLLRTRAQDRDIIYAGPSIATHEESKNDLNYDEASFIVRLLALKLNDKEREQVLQYAQFIKKV